VFQVQRAAVSVDSPWKTLTRHKEEAKARADFDRQRKLHSSGRFRVTDPDGKVILEGKAKSLFERDDSDDEHRKPTYYVPPPPSTAPG
jgi:hypothetical protein